MFDLRDFKGAIREAVRQERHKDQNWSWKVLAINKDIAKIGWGYLDYLEDKSWFGIEIVGEPDGLVAVVGSAPNGHRVFRFVGDDPFADAKSVEDGIGVAVRDIAKYAHNVY